MCIEFFYTILVRYIFLCDKYVSSPTSRTSKNTCSTSPKVVFNRGQYTGCFKRDLPYFGSTFLRWNYIDDKIYQYQGFSGYGDSVARKLWSYSSTYCASCISRCVIRAPVWHFTDRAQYGRYMCMCMCTPFGHRLQPVFAHHQDTYIYTHTHTLARVGVCIYVCRTR
jgi:hypothetical protein